MKTLLCFFLPFSVTIKGTDIKPGIKQITQAVKRPDNFNDWIRNIQFEVNLRKGYRKPVKNRMYSKSQFNF